MTTLQKLLFKQNRLATLQQNGKNIKSGGVVRKLQREIRKLEREVC